ncbi:MAG: beta-glucosidase [Phycisphaerales bacterium]|nr:beta-glucosidase [Phycisphaerales bacterium]
MPTNRYCAFPSTFLWGAATAAYQVEGAAAEDGRSPSVWDTFCRRPGAIAMDHNGDVACDHYRRSAEDVKLMKSLGLQAYRFSISWSRVQPAVDGKPNQKGLDFYSRLVDDLLAAGIQPWATLFHWDLPQWCEDEFRGWESKDCAHHFADYSAMMARTLGDRLAGLFTINEFFCYLEKGYGADTHEPFAPCKRVDRKALAQARHHAVYGHGLAAQAFRSNVKGKCPPVGLAENTPAVVPVRETAENIRLAKEAMREMAGMYLTPILEGAYHPAYLEGLGADAPTFTAEEMRVIHTPLDYVGLNLYTPTYIRPDPESKRGWAQVHHNDSYPRMVMPWLGIGPSILYWAPRLVAETWGVKSIYITENGCANGDIQTEQGDIHDTARMMFLQNHFIQAHRAVDEGVPLHGYFLWSLLDNFEWATGYTRRFGLCYVNYQTQQRTPKLSAKFYRDVIRRNAVGGTIEE